MTITIKIATDNEAFSDSKHLEIARILRDWLVSADLFEPGMTNLRDYNGNTVGSVTIKGK